MHLFPFRVRSQSFSSVSSPPTAKQNYKFIEGGAASDDDIDRKRSRKGSDSSGGAVDNLSASFRQYASLGMEQVINNATTPKNEDSRPRRVEDLAQFYYPIPRAPKNASDIRRGKRSRFFSFSKRGERKDETPHQDTSNHSKKRGANNSSPRESRDEHEEVYESELASVSGMQSSTDDDETYEDDDDLSHDALKSFEKGRVGKSREDFCIRQIKIPTSRSTFQPIKIPTPLVTNADYNSNNNNNWGLASAFIVVPDENTPQGSFNQLDTYPHIGIDKNMSKSGSPLLNQRMYQVVPVSPVSQNHQLNNDT